MGLTITKKGLLNTHIEKKEEIGGRQSDLYDLLIIVSVSRSINLAPDLKKYYFTSLYSIFYLL